MAANQPTDTKRSPLAGLPRSNGVGDARSNGTRSVRARRARIGVPDVSSARDGSSPRSRSELRAYSSESLARLSQLAGTRLNDHCVWMLQAIAAEPGLGNREAGERASIFSQAHAGEVVRRLRRAGLVLNTQAGRTPQGNAWQLTPAGEELERAIRRETSVLSSVRLGSRQAIATAGAPAPSGSVVALAEPADVRVNARGLSILKAIGAEPGLSNKEIGQRVGIPSLAQIGELLRRLAQRELIVNTQPGRNPKANAWQLTSAGLGLISAANTPLVGAARHTNGSGARPISVEPAASAGAPADDQRARIVAAVVSLVYAEGVHAVNPERLTRSAQVSRESLDECFDSPDAALLAAFEHGLEQAYARARAAWQAEHGWLEQVRVALLAGLEFFDEQPALAMLLLVHSADGCPALRARRTEVLARLAQLLDGGRSAARSYPPPLTARAVLNGVLGVLHEWLNEPDSRPLTELSAPLMSFIVAPFLGAAAARRELARPAVVGRAVAARRSAQELLHNFSGRGMRHPLAPRVLHVVGAEPGLSNSDVAERAGVSNEGHMSRVLARLKRLGLIENSGATAHLPGRPNTWHLTSRGEEVEESLRYEVSLAEEQRAFRRALWLTKEKAKSAGGVYTTAMRLLAYAWQRDRRHGHTARDYKEVRWVLLDASGLLLLHCCWRFVPRALPTAFAPLPVWPNKRSCLDYTILSRAATISVYPRQIDRCARPAEASNDLAASHFGVVHARGRSRSRSARCSGRSRRINTPVGSYGRFALGLEHLSRDRHVASRDLALGLPRHHYRDRSCAS
jgi:AcrR family transcriptional regulator/DNA-binding MarR family transcriptional regulator/DNA-binding HxlR family transcriptional regulator